VEGPQVSTAENALATQIICNRRQARFGGNHSFKVVEGEDATITPTVTRITFRVPEGSFSYGYRGPNKGGVEWLKTKRCNPKGVKGTARVWSEDLQRDVRLRRVEDALFSNWKDRLPDRGKGKALLGTAEITMCVQKTQLKASAELRRGEEKLKKGGGLRALSEKKCPRNIAYQKPAAY